MKKLFAMLAILTLVAGACGGDDGGGGGEKTGTETEQPLTKVRFVLSFRPNSDVLPYAVGIQEGFYQDEGLDVEVLDATDPVTPLKTIASGTHEMGYGFGPDLLLAAEQGLPLVSVYAIMQTASFGIISFESAGIDSPADLAGKAVGITSIPIDQVSFDAMLASAGLDRETVKVVDVGFTGQEVLLNGRVDAISALTWGEGATYSLLGRPWKFLFYHDYGVPDYQFEVIVVNREFLENNPDTVKAFLRATTKAIEFALQNPEKAVDDLVAQYPDLDLKEKRAVWDAIAKDVVSPLTDQYGIGYQDPEQWSAITQFFLDNGLINTRPDLTQVFTNDYYKG